MLAWKFGSDYLVIFCSSAILHLVIEAGLAFSGIRKGEVYVFGRKLSRTADVMLKAIVEGPAFCVPAFFVADQFMSGNAMAGVIAAVVVVGAASVYMGFADRRGLQKLDQGDEPLITRRAMTSPRALLLLGLINIVCLIALFMIEPPYRTHAIIYVASYSVLVMLFYLVNYNFGVRYVEVYDSSRKEYRKPGHLVQAAGLTYDSVYEMGLLISPAYWVVYYMGGWGYGGM